MTHALVSHFKARPSGPGIHRLSTLVYKQIDSPTPAMPLSPVLAFVASNARAGTVASRLYELDAGADR